MKKILVLMAIVVIVSSCSKDDPAPAASANFTFTGDNVFGPAKVTFVDNSINAVTRSWDFGDGATSTEIAPIHLFAPNKTYTVTLTVTNSDNVPNKTSKSVIILAAPSKLNILSVKLEGISFLNGSGGGWDSDGPDIYFNIPQGNISTNYFNNVQSTQLPLTFNQSDIFPIGVSDLTATIDYSFYDYDITTDEFMGGYEFKLNDFMPTDGTAYPTTLTFQNTGNPLKFTFSIEWKP